MFKESAFQTLPSGPPDSADRSHFAKMSLSKMSTVTFEACHVAALLVPPYTFKQRFLENPMERPFIPSWNRVLSAEPEIKSMLLNAVEQDMAEFGT